MDYENLSSGEQMLRAVQPEARLIINGSQVNVGGLYGQKQNAYLFNDWVDKLKTGGKDFRYKCFTVAERKMYRKIAPWLTEPHFYAPGEFRSPKGKKLYRSTVGQPAMRA